MPLSYDLRRKVLDYCDAHLDSDVAVSAMFSFLNKSNLQQRIEAEFYAARYIYKLSEALDLSDKRLEAHVKFQIVQYAGIYEAIIVHMLWEVYKSHPAVLAIEYHSSLKIAATLPNSVSFSLTGSGEELLLCVDTKQKTPRISIKFDDKVDACVSIGFLDPVLAGEIKQFYRLRNAIHLERAIKDSIVYELDSSLLAYRRMRPFVRGISGFLANGTLPNDAKIVATSLPSIAASP